MWGVSQGDYAVYWLGMAVITVIAIISGLVSWGRNRRGR